MLPFYKIRDANVGLLEHHRNDWIESGCGNWEMPQIEEKIIMTSFMKEKLRI
jgi:hypothetical protein